MIKSEQYNSFNFCDEVSSGWESFYDFFGSKIACRSQGSDPHPDALYQEFKL